jgi:hypothetical protein
MPCGEARAAWSVSLTRSVLHAATTRHSVSPPEPRHCSPESSHAVENTAQRQKRLHKVPVRTRRWSRSRRAGSRRVCGSRRPAPPQSRPRSRSRRLQPTNPQQQQRSAAPVTPSPSPAQPRTPRGGTMAYAGQAGRGTWTPSPWEGHAQTGQTQAGAREGADARTGGVDRVASGGGVGALDVGVGQAVELLRLRVLVTR